MAAARLAAAAAAGQHEEEGPSIAGGGADTEPLRSGARRWTFSGKGRQLILCLYGSRVLSGKSFTCAKQMKQTFLNGACHWFPETKKKIPVSCSHRSPRRCPVRGRRRPPPRFAPTAWAAPWRARRRGRPPPLHAAPKGAAASRAL